MSLDGDRNLQVNKGNFQLWILEKEALGNAVIAPSLSNLT